jgi:hypothetical protein
LFLASLLQIILYVELYVSAYCRPSISIRISLCKYYIETICTNGLGTPETFILSVKQKIGYREQA